MIKAVNTLMRKIPFIFSTILLSTFAHAGDAPTDIESNGISLNVGGEVMVEAIAIEWRCQTKLRQLMFSPMS